MKDKFNRPLRDLRVSVIDKCNFRCPYCMPAKIYGEGYSFLPNHELLSFEEISRLIRIFAAFGLKKVRITGGEPLIRPNLETLIKSISNSNPSLDISLTTNGYLLKDKAMILKEFGLNRLTVSLDTLDDNIFKKMNGKDISVSKVIEGIEAAEDAGFSLSSNSSGTILGFSFTGSSIPEGEGTLCYIQTTSDDDSSGTLWIDTAIFADPSGNSYSVDPGDEFIIYEDVYGCLDNNACNYNPEANIDDGSCEYPEDNYDCDGNCNEEIDECGICAGDGSSCELYFNVEIPETGTSTLFILLGLLLLLYT